MITPKINSYTQHHKLGLKLRPILVGELYLAKRVLQPVYIYKDFHFCEVLAAGGVPSKDLINLLIRNSHREVYVSSDDVDQIRKNLEQALIKVTRSLSVGDPLENGQKDIKLLSLNLGGLYQNPHNDELLMLQFQSTQNLGKFLLDNKKLHSSYFHNLTKESFHFTLSQPMLSSLMLLSYLQTIHLFHDKEIENLFLASYLKDIGLSIIPEDKYDQMNLTDQDQKLFADHSQFSFDLLEGRIPLSKNYLTIIKSHHFLNHRLLEIINKAPRATINNSMVHGIESILVGVFDMFVAMTSDRPYRKGMTPFQSLELIKKLMADDYPQEFRALVIFIKQFYKN
ncbi:MAG: hypothetical protein WDA09_02595 [Bacteriovoracaceae bacterium]